MKQRRKKVKRTNHTHPRRWGIVIRKWNTGPQRASWVKRWKRLFKAEKRYMESRQGKGVSND